MNFGTLERKKLHVWDALKVPTTLAALYAQSNTFENETAYLSSYATKWFLRYYSANMNYKR